MRIIQREVCLSLFYLGPSFYFMQSRKKGFNKSDKNGFKFIFSQKQDKSYFLSYIGRWKNILSFIPYINVTVYAIATEESKLPQTMLYPLLSILNANC